MRFNPILSRIESTRLNLLDLDIGSGVNLRSMKKTLILATLPLFVFSFASAGRPVYTTLNREALVSQSKLVLVVKDKDRGSDAALAQDQKCKEEAQHFRVVEKLKTDGGEVGSEIEVFSKNQQIIEEACRENKKPPSYPSSIYFSKKKIGKNKIIFIERIEKQKYRFIADGATESVDDQPAIVELIKGTGLKTSYPSVIAVKGKVTWNDQDVNEKTVFTGPVRLKTNGGSAIILKWDEMGSEIRVAPESEITWKDTKSEPELVRGKVLCHIRTKSKSEDDASSFSLRARYAQMGVRGTKFMAVTTPILGEAEIVVFEGVVEFKSLENPDDKRMITEGYWGGIGGRFGAKTSTPVKLPAAALDSLQNSKEFKASSSKSGS